jgi:hypothetical protein
VVGRWRTEGICSFDVECGQHDGGGSNVTDEGDRTRTVADLDGDWSVAGGRLYHAADAPGEPGRFGGSLGADALAAALDAAVETVAASPPDATGYAVPLHDPDEPVITDEYVLWRPDTGQFGWYDTAFGIDGTVRFVDVGEAARSTITDRVRHWHPAERVETAGSDVPAGDASDTEDSERGARKVPPAVVEPGSPRSGAAVDALFEACREAVEAEREAARTANRARHRSASLQALVDDGVATGPFVSLGRANREDRIGAFTLQLAAGADERGSAGLDLHPESVLLVDSTDPDAAFPLAVRTTRVDGPVVRVKPAMAGDVPLARFEALLSDRDRDFYCSPLVNPVPFERRTNALDAVAADASTRTLFAGAKSIRFDADDSATPGTPLALNEYQRRAVKWAVDAHDVALVHGPPGTGKTRTLTAFVLQAAARGERVLVTAHSNQAVDALLVGDSTRDDADAGTLHAFASGARGDVDVDVARVGRQSTNPVVNAHYANAAVANADVVAATTNGAARFDTDAFDVGVVDEATQASRPATAIVVDAAERVVLAGDHRQLPPYEAEGTGGAETQSGTAQRTRRSWFEDVLDRYGDDVAVLLGRQYRMHDAIAAFPNDAFYGGRLESADRNRDWRIDGLEPLVGVDVTGPERQEAGGHSYWNPSEVGVVVDELRALFAHDVAPEDVGVIAMYAAQADRIRARLAESDVVDGRRVTVDTVDSFQGGEREAIVVSFVRSNDRGDGGFLDRPEVGARRLNVALTRARRRLVLVGDWDTLAAIPPHRDPDDSAANHYAALATRLHDDRMRDP